MFQMFSKVLISIIFFNLSKFDPIFMPGWYYGRQSPGTKFNYDMQSEAGYSDLERRNITKSRC